MELDGNVLIRQLGSFWSRRFPGASKVYEFLSAWCLPFYDMADRAAAAIEGSAIKRAAKISRLRRISVSFAAESAVNKGYATIGSGTVGDGTVGERREVWVVPLPVPMSDIAYIQREIDGTSPVLIRGTHFELVGDTLEFYRYSDIPMITGPDGNMVSMWLIGVKLVNRAFKERYGAVINSGDTMEEYERRTTALWDAMVSGGTTLPIKQLLSIGTGGYFCSRAQRVECVTDAWVIAQDFAAPREFCQSYSVGDIIEAGTMLAPADMERLSSWPDWMAGVDIDSTLQGVGAPLRAKNAEVPVVTLDEVSTFELSGEGATAFFAQVNDSGWLSEVLAKNGHSVSVNPAKFLLGCLSGSGKVIRLQAWAANIKLHLWLLQQLAKVWPAHVGLLVVLEGDNENYARSLRSTIARLSELYNG